jgi:hypothetical protein
MPPPAPPPSWQPSPPTYGAPHDAAGWYPHGGYGYPRPQDTNGFAIASLVCSLAGILVWFLGPLLGIVFGLVALKQIPRLGQGGRGLAIAGVSVGTIVLLLNVLFVIAAVTTGPSGGSIDVNV